MLARPPVGLTEFVFHHNTLGNRFVESLAQAITTDPYVRKIDISHNSITNEDVLLGPFIEAMKSNESLINVDLKGNKGSTAEVKRQLALCLLKNLEIYKATGQAIKPSWLDLKQLEPLDGQISQLMEGFSLAEENGGRSTNEKLRLIDDVKPDSSFQLGKPSLKNANSHKSRTSIKSRDSGGKPGVQMKARMDVSGDKSMDMFAFDINSV